MQVHGKAPGKVILFGEHFVVYGYPSIVMAINKYVHVVVSKRGDERIYISSRDLGIEGLFYEDKYLPIKGSKEDSKIFRPVKACVDLVREVSGAKFGVNVIINSEIPVASGLGSSAALAVAAIASLLKLSGAMIDLNELNRLAFEIEKIVHGTPSGIDNTISTYGGFLVFKRSREGHTIEKIKGGGKLTIIIGDTEVPRSTKALVDRVRKLYEEYPDLVGSIFSCYNKLFDKARNALLNNDVRELGRLMLINHGLLWSIGVSHPKLDELIHSALNSGALGAKLTGAGGGGCIIALTTEDRVKDIALAIKKSGGRPIIASTDEKGVQVWVEND